MPENTFPTAEYAHTSMTPLGTCPEDDFAPATEQALYEPLNATLRGAHEKWVAEQAKTVTEERQTKSETTLQTNPKARAKAMERTLVLPSVSNADEPEVEENSGEHKPTWLQRHPRLARTYLFIGSLFSLILGGCASPTPQEVLKEATNSPTPTAAPSSTVASLPTATPQPECKCTGGQDKDGNTADLECGKQMEGRDNTFWTCNAPGGTDGWKNITPSQEVNVEEG